MALDIERNSATVYVKLLDEAVEVWRPVEAQKLGNNLFKLLPNASYDPELEEWEITPGSIVACEEKLLSHEQVLVAVRATPSLKPESVS